MFAVDLLDPLISEITIQIFLSSVVSKPEPLITYNC